jgi:nucleoside-diphosphate-sugar epimerase
MKIAITGITGFVGKHLSVKLIENSHKVFGIVRLGSDTAFLKDRGIRYYTAGSKDPHEISNFLKRNNIDGIIHLASKFVVKHSIKDVNDMMASNLLFPSLLIEAAADAGIKWFINTGTAWQNYKGEPYCPVNLYAASKQAFQDILSFYIETSTLNIITLKLNDTYGEGDTRKKLVNIWLRSLQTGDYIKMSPGKQLIDLLHIDDVVKAYVRAIELVSRDKKRKLNGKVYSVMSGRQVTLRKLAQILEKTSRRKLNVAWSATPYRDREVMVPSKYHINVPGWQPKVSLERGLKMILDEYKRK